MPATPPLVPVPRTSEFKVTIGNYADGTRARIEHKGTLSIEGEVAIVSAKAPISLLPYPLCWRMVREEIPLCEIFNIAHDGTAISFDRVKGGVTSSRITLHAANQQDAAAILALLPARITPEYVEQRKQHEAFTTALTTATPTAFVTPIIIALNVLVFVAMGVAGVGWFAPDPERMLSWGADFWPLTTSGEWWRFLTSAFLHFGVIHLAMNMWALGSVGTLTERLYGNRFFIAIYLFGAITSSLASNWWNRDAVSAGASGAVFAVYGAMLAYLVFQPASFPKGAVQSLLGSSLGFLAYNVVYGFGHAGINNAAHLGGLAGGIVLGIVLCRPLDLPRRAGQAVPRSVLGAVIGMAAISAGLYYLPKSGVDIKAERVFVLERQSFAAEEEKVLNAYNALVEQAKAGTLSDAEFAQRLESQVMPKWEELADRFSAITISDASPSRALHGALVRYCQTRRDSYRALRDALRTGSEQKVEEHKSLTERVDQIIREIEQAATLRP